MSSNGGAPIGKRVTVEWLHFGFAWEKTLAPTLEEDGSRGEQELAILIVQDPSSGDTHKFFFDEDAKQQLIQGVTGGLVLPS